MVYLHSVLGIEKTFFGGFFREAFKFTALKCILADRSKKNILILS